MQCSIDIILFLLAEKENFLVDWVDVGGDINVGSNEVAKEIMVVYT